MLLPAPIQPGGPLVVVVVLVAVTVMVVPLVLVVVVVIVEKLFLTLTRNVEREVESVEIIYPYRN